MRRDIKDFNNTINQNDLIRKHSTKPQQKMYSFQVHAEHLPRQTIFQAIKQDSIHSKEFNSYKVSSLTTMKLNLKSVTEISLK